MVVGAERPCSGSPIKVCDGGCSTAHSPNGCGDMQQNDGRRVDYVEIKKVSYSRELSKQFITTSRVWPKMKRHTRMVTW